VEEESIMTTDRTTSALELALQLLAAVEDAEVFLPGDTSMPRSLMDIRDQIEGTLINPAAAAADHWHRDVHAAAPGIDGSRQ
jgi:hypothetical protein